jgi:hypothetical protein
MKSASFTFLFGSWSLFVDSRTPSSRTELCDLVIGNCKRVTDVISRSRQSLERKKLQNKATSDGEIKAIFRSRLQGVDERHLAMF